MPEFNAQQELEEDGYLVIGSLTPCNVGDVLEITSPAWDGGRPLGKVLVIGKATREEAKRQLQRQSPGRPYDNEYPHLYKVAAE